MAGAGTKSFEKAAALGVMPTLIGLALFAGMSALYLADHGLYLALLRAAGMDPQNIAFIDSQFLYAAKKCWDLGYNVYKEVPCYPIPGTFSYSPLWLRLPLPDDTDAARITIGLVTDILFILSITLLPRPQSPREAILMTIALVSTAVLFAMERNNADVWMFLLVVAGGRLLTRTDPGRWAGYGFFLLAGLLKYYPITLLLLTLREKPKQCLAILSVVACIGVAFLLRYHSELAASLANIPYGSPFGDMIGIANLPRNIAIMFSAYGSKPGTPDPTIAPLFRLILTALLVCLAIRTSRRPGFVSAWAQLGAADKIWLAIGCTLMAGCYIMIQSVSYRLIYMLIVLSGFLAFRRASADARTTQGITTAINFIVLAMWMEGMRHWADIVMHQFHARPATGNLVFFLGWLVRELTWLYLATVMLAIVIVFATQSPRLRWLMRNSRLA